MDTKDSEFISELSSAIGDELKDALNSTFGIEATKERDDALLKVAEQKTIEDLRTYIMQELISIFKTQQKSNVRQIERTVDKFLSKVVRRCNKALGDSPYLYSSINYDERYDAMQKISSTDSLLKRIEQTINAQERQLRKTHNIDVAKAISDNTTLFLNCIDPLKELKVSEPGDPQIEMFRLKIESLLKGSQIEKEAMNPVESIVRDSFKEIYGSQDCLESDAARFEKKLDDEREFLVQAAAKASEKAFAFIEERAQAVTGKHIFAEMPKPFVVETLFTDSGGESGNSFLRKGSVDHVYLEKLEALLQEVRSAFQKYSQCLKDNGIFCAFPEGGKYGEVGSRRAESYGLDSFGYYGRNFFDSNVHVRGAGTSKEIPDVVENQSKDDIDAAISRMKTFNAKPYWGALDDNPTEPVEAFWYGFKELMILSDAINCINFRPYYLYIEKSCQKISRQATKYGTNMDECQIKQFQEDINKLST